MSARVLSSSMLILLVAVTGACSPHEFSDPTGATRRVIYERSAAAQPTPDTVKSSSGTVRALTEDESKKGPGDQRKGSHDIVELATGHRIEGQLRHVNVAEVAIEAGGQVIRFERDKVRAIYFGIATSAPVKP